MVDERVEPWAILGDRPVHQASIFSVRKVRARSGLTGREHDFDVLQSPDWVNVIALTDADRVVLIRQFRHGTRSVTVEIPGGAIDPGEEPLAAAQRELAEETGYVAGTWEQIGVVEPNPAFQTNKTFTFLAKGARKERAPQPDENEEIAVEERELKEIPGFLQDGTITHALVWCAFCHLALRGGLELG